MIDQIHTKLTELLSTELSISVEAYTRIHKRTALPCGRLRLSEIEPSIQQPGSGQTSAICRFELFIVAVPEVEQAEITLQLLAAQAIHALHRPQRILPGVGTIKVTSSSENGFDPEFDGFLVWQVNFAMTVLLGDALSWQVPGLPPQIIYIDPDPSNERKPLEDYEVLDV